mgnify:CR=1 FL=1
MRPPLPLLLVTLFVTIGFGRPVQAGDPLPAAAPSSPPESSAASASEPPPNTTPVPLPLRPVDMNWASPSGQDAIRESWMMGGEALAGPYALRVRLTAGARVPVHRHPDDRVVTVLAGTVHAGFGGIFDETRTVAMQTGTVFLVPADESHYLWARDGDAEYQENGVGPTGQSRGW